MLPASRRPTSRNPRPRRSRGGGRPPRPRKTGWRRPHRCRPPSSRKAVLVVEILFSQPRQSGKLRRALFGDPPEFAVKRIGAAFAAPAAAPPLLVKLNTSPLVRPPDRQYIGRESCTERVVQTVSTSRCPVP